MGSAYPGALDSLSTTNNNGTNAHDTHPALHNDANDAINKLEAELGINPSGASSDVVARLAALDTLVAAKLPSSYLDTDGALAANSDAKVASQKATKTYADTKQSALGYTAENSANKDTDATMAANSDTKYASQKATKTALATKQDSLGFTAENVANKDTDNTLAANSDTKYASQKAVKGYVDTASGLLVPKTYLDTDTALAANSDVKVATQKATKAYVDAEATARALHDPWRVEINPLTPPRAQTNFATLVQDSLQILAGYVVSTGAQNATIGWDVVLSAGTWRIDIIGLKNTSCGIITAAIDGSTVGTMDQYAAALSRSQLQAITGITVASTGKKALDFTMATKNASSSNYTGALSWVLLRRTA